MEAALTDGRSPRLRLGVLLWLSGMLGAVVLTVLILPDLLAGETLPIPLWALTLASVAQSGVLLALGTWTGVALARKVGLHAPAFEAAAASQPVAPALRPQLAPGLLWGLLAGALLAALSLIAPAALTAVQARFDPPLVARVLYGGITEELLLRWGLMTLLVWGAWRFVQRGQGVPRAHYVWAAIGLSALLFGAGHLPTAAAVVGDLTGEVAAFVVGANTVFGVLFGYLYWRYGLEAAMIAHAFAHVVEYTATLF